ncbi:MAG: type IV secretory system conjugative DNA transfer family protein, partial [Sphingomonadales bacterium]
MTPHHKARLLGVLGLALAAQAAVAGNYYGNSYHGYSGRDYELALTLLRAAMMAGATFTGYLIGWFFSPQAKELRRLVAALLALAAVLAALFDDGPLGWSMTSMVAMIGFCLALGYWLGTAIQSLIEVPSTFGTAHWATAEEITEAGLWGTAGYVIGAAKSSTALTPIAYAGLRHLLLVAPTRSGKGVSQIIPNLLSHPGSVVVIDPKGENAMITAKARQEMGQTVHIVDPWGIVAVDGIETARLNPLDWLRDGDSEITENSMILAEALVARSEGNEKFWAEEAKALLQGVLLYLATDPHEDGRRTLGRLRDLLLLDGEELKALFQRMLGSPHHVVASTGARCLQKDYKLLSNVLASAQA